LFGYACGWDGMWYRESWNCTGISGRGQLGNLAGPATMHLQDSSLFSYSGMALFGRSRCQPCILVVGAGGLEGQSAAIEICTYIQAAKST
jgi:hypothetical protein